VLVIGAIKFLPWDSHLSLITKPLKQCTTIEETKDTLELLLKFFLRRESKGELNIIFRGYLLHHNAVYVDSNCSLKMPSLAVEVNRTSANMKKKGTVDSVEESLLNYLNTEFSNALNKYPNDISLQLDYALFMIEHMKNFYLGLRTLNECIYLSPSIKQEFLIYRYKHLLSSLQSTKNSADRVTNSSSMQYDDTYKIFIEKLNHASLLHVQLWSYLSEDSPDLVKVKNTGFHILRLIKQVSSLWSKLQSLIPNVPASLRDYANFHMYVLNDQETGKRLIGKSSNYMVIRNSLNRYKGKSSGDCCNFTGDGIPCLFVSGKQNTPGNIIDCNLALCRDFGYKKEDLEKKNFSSLIADISSRSILELLESLDDNNKDTIMLHRSKYIFPARIRIVEKPSLMNESKYVLLVYKDRQIDEAETIHVLLDKKFIILRVSSTAITELGLTAEQVEKNKINFTSLTNDFANGEHKKYIGEMALSLTYKYSPSVDNTSDINDDNKRNFIGQVKRSERTIELKCKLTEVLDKGNEVVGYYMKLYMTKGNKKTVANSNSSNNQVEFYYHRETNKYYQDNPNADQPP